MPRGGKHGVRRRHQQLCPGACTRVSRRAGVRDALRAAVQHGRRVPVNGGGVQGAASAAIQDPQAGGRAPSRRAERVLHGALRRSAGDKGSTARCMCVWQAMRCC